MRISEALGYARRCLSFAKESWIALSRCRTKENNSRDSRAEEGACKTRSDPANQRAPRVLAASRASKRDATSTDSPADERGRMEKCSLAGKIRYHVCCFDCPCLSRKSPTVAESKRQGRAWGFSITPENKERPRSFLLGSRLPLIENPPLRRSCQPPATMSATTITSHSGVSAWSFVCRQLQRCRQNTRLPSTTDGDRTVIFRPATSTRGSPHKSM